MNIHIKIITYLKARQSPLVRYLHISIVFLVLSQIIVSNVMEIHHSGEIGSSALEFYGTWLHILTGLVFIPVVLAFLIVEFRLHGFKYFFPYLSGEFTQCREDVGQLVKFKLPDPQAYGIAAIVEGLGLAGLFLVIFSGLSWFIAWQVDLPWTDDIKEVHELLTGVVEAYIIGHGSIGLLHIFLPAKSLKAE